MPPPKFSDYTIVIRPDSGMWFAYMPGFPECYAQGDTLDEARQELEGVFEMTVRYFIEHDLAFPADVGELVAVAS
jgi:predicted RNase H-like HicB family nuclease